MKEAISRSDFESRTGLKTPSLSVEINKIVPLKEIICVEDLKIMSEHYLDRLLRSAILEGNPSVQPYKDAVIEHHRMDPTSLRIAQTFIERKKYQRLIEVVSGLFSGFCTNKGFAKCTALIVIGKTNESEEKVMAHYLPPLLEIHETQPCLIDGTHRNYITGSIGTTIESVIMRNVFKPPCIFGLWKDVRVVDEKPPRNERFHNLDPYYFRNLGYSGIDG